jgi:hypothetical protein
LRTIGTTYASARHNLDGFVVYGGQAVDASGYEAYTQVFRNGIIEATNSEILDGKKRLYSNSIPSQFYEHEIIAALDSMLKLLGSLGVEPPLTVMLSLVGVKELTMALPQRYIVRAQPGIDRDVLLLPEVVIEGDGPGAEEILKPIFEAVWQAAGFERNYNYDESGRRQPSARHPVEKEETLKTGSAFICM